MKLILIGLIRDNNMAGPRPARWDVAGRCIRTKKRHPVPPGVLRTVLADLHNRVKSGFVQHEGAEWGWKLL